MKKVICSDNNMSVDKVAATVGAALSTNFAKYEHPIIKLFERKVLEERYDV